MSKSLRKRLIALSFLVVCLIFLILPTTPLSVLNASSELAVVEYSNAFEDLCKDENFSVDNYPVNKEDNSLSVIQVAESVNKELFVYVYQSNSPNEMLQATSINISLNLHNNLSFKNYELSLINSRGVFYKYRVVGLVVSNDVTRYYEISSIYRSFIDGIDKNASSNNVIAEVPFAVSKQYTFYNFDSDLQISVFDVDEIEIIDKYVGYVRYGYATGYNDADLEDRHFVAFSTDRRIDKLLECDIYYKEQKVVTYYNSFNDYPVRPKNVEYGTISDAKYKTLTYSSKQDVTADHGLWWGNKNYSYSWDVIQNPNDFIQSVNQQRIYKCGIFNVSFDSELTEDSLNNIKGKDWVVSFLTTNYHYEYTGTAPLRDDATTQTLVSDVSVLRLSFETDGFVYDLGVIDNKQTGDGLSDNFTKKSVSLLDAIKELLEKLATGIKVLLIIALMCLVVPVVILLWNIIKFIWKIISLPFKAIKKIINKKNKH